MKFYTIEHTDGSPLGCCLTVRECHEVMAAQFYPRDQYTIAMEEVDVSAESVRLLLARQGGYAKDQRQVWPRENP